jgi:putative ABC transport system substrate-binding protein
MNPRRRFLAASILFTFAAGSRAQARTYRMALLSGSASSDQSVTGLLKPFFTRLEELGYHEGRNLTVERRFAEGRLERLPALAMELVALKPDVIVAFTTPPSLAAAKATTTIPIVFSSVSDPVGSGLVSSLARPGGNVTGISSQNSETHIKRLEVLREALPSASRVAVLHNPLNPAELAIVATLRQAAKSFQFEIQPMEARSRAELSAAFTALTAERSHVLYVVESQFSFAHRHPIIEFAGQARIPDMYGLTPFVEAGGLMSYSFDVKALNRSAANYVVKVLHGTSPAELPVEQPTTFELALNLGRAKALGLAFPPAVMLRADRLIE